VVIVAAVAAVAAVISVARVLGVRLVLVVRPVAVVVVARGVRVAGPCPHAVVAVPVAPLMSRLGLSVTILDVVASTVGARERPALRSRQRVDAAMAGMSRLVGVIVSLTAVRAMAGRGVMRADRDALGRARVALGLLRSRSVTGDGVRS
jgi:hypothetical protein